jgi:acyl-CoA reductase-like NAD-dependent aldehyde dehydrogenase
MGWDRGRYYTRSKKVNGRVVRQYIGKGESAEQAAQVDAAIRAAGQAQAAAERDERARIQGVVGQVAALCEQTDMLARAVLVAAGYRRHNRGEWRRQRGRQPPRQ